MTLTIGFDPILARLGPFELGWHGIATVVAVFVAAWLGLRLARAAGIPQQAADDALVYALVGGIVGARLFHVLDHLSTFLADPLSILAVWQGGIAVYGAFIGGIAGGLVAARRRGIPVWLGLDVAAVPMLVGQAIGRLGCLANGDAWGAPTGGDWGVVYTHPNDLLPHSLLGVPTHPYPLYEIAADLALAVALVLLRRRQPRPGVAFLAGALGYAAIRFSLTFVRQETIVALGLQEAQLIALATALAGAALLALRLRGVGRRVDLAESRST